MTLRASAPLRKSLHLLPATALLLATHAVMAQVHKPAPQPAPAESTPALKPQPAAPVPDRAAAYYHDSLAHLYEELAVNNGRPDYAAQAVEEYKLALNADPGNKYLQDGLADMYFRIGRIREAINSAQDQIKKDPNDLSAHTLLGKVYLRSLGDMQGPQAGEMLQLAIAEYEKLAQLKPKDLETHLLLGQLYGLNHQTARAQAEFKIAQSLDSNSEDAVLNMARLYTEQGQPQQAVDALSAIPPDDRSSRIDFALGASYDQLHKSKQAADAYRAGLEDEPDNTDAQRALAASLFADGQLAESLAVYQQISQMEPNDLQAEVKISEVQRRLGHFDDALASIRRAKSLPGSADNLELSFNEAVLYDAMGKYDQSAATLQAVITATTRADGKYTDQDKSNRATFLDRLAVVDREQGKIPEAIAAYKQIVDLGGDYLLLGYQGEVTTYTEAHQWKDTVAVAATAARALPKNRGVQLLYAFNLAVSGQPDQGLALANSQLNGTADDLDTHVDIANIDLELHRYDDAMAHLDKADALATTPDQRINIVRLRATILDRDKQFSAAEVQYRKALTIDPNDATTLNDFGYMLADRGDRLPEAIKMIQKAVEFEPQNGAFLDSLGWAYFKLGQYAPAEENLHKAIERSPTDASIHDHLGQVYEKTGRLKLAVEQWERSMTEYARTLPADADPAEVAKVKRELDDARTKLARVGPTSSKKS